MEQIANDLATMQRTPLHDAHVDALRKAGRIVRYEPGDVIFSVGEPAARFIYVLDGEVEVFDPFTGKRYLPFTIGPTQFLGEINFLSGAAYTVPLRAVQATEVIEVDRPVMLDLMSRMPEMSDIVITVFSARRRRMLEASDTSLKLIGIDQDRAIRRIAAFAARNRIPFKAIELNSDEGRDLAQVCQMHDHRPAVIFGETTVVDDPTPAKVAQLLGMDLALGEEEVFDVLIVGGGPSGVAAGVYAGAEGLSALVVEDTAIGGQAGQSSRIENYMGFPTGISGADLTWRGEVQAMKFGTRFAMPRRVMSMERREDGLFCVTLDNAREVCARAVVVATGVQYRRLPLDRLEHFEGAGIFYAATELEARFCKDTEVVVVGGGNSAGQAAMFLCRSTKHVHVLVRGPSLAASMSDYLTQRLESDPGVTIHYRTQMAELHGGDSLEGLTVHDAATGTDRRIDARAAFVMVGAAPNTDWLQGVVELDAKGFVKTGPDVGSTSPYQTSAPGIFAVGDVRAGSVKRVASSVGEGSVVISAAWDYVNNG